MPSAYADLVHSMNADGFAIRKVWRNVVWLQRRGLEFSSVLPRLRHNDISPRFVSCGVERTFDRIELWRSPRTRNENPKRGRCSHADSVETLRIA